MNVFPSFSIEKNYHGPSQQKPELSVLFNYSFLFSFSFTWIIGSILNYIVLDNEMVVFQHNI
jgi:hypothetical protein